MNCLYAQLKQEALLHIAGPDSLKFLQGQTTCDTRKVTPQTAIPGAFCTPQGRVICDFLLSELAPEHFALRMRRDIRTNSGAAFGKYIIFSKAKLDVDRDDWQVFAVWGEDASKAIQEVFGAAPVTRFGASSGHGFAVVQTDTSGQAFECYLQSPGNTELLARIDALVSPGTEADWHVQQIANGTARVEANSVEEYVPQTLNYDLTGHISFNKGCYTGQEVVARLHYRGKAKRRTYLFELADESNCPVGSPLFTADADQAVGNVVNISSHHGRTQLLATSTASGITTGLHLGSPDGPVLTRSPLPYPVEPD